MMHKYFACMHTHLNICAHSVNHHPHCFLHQAALQLAPCKTLYGWLVPKSFCFDKLTSDAPKDLSEPCKRDLGMAGPISDNRCHRPYPPLDADFDFLGDVFLLPFFFGGGLPLPLPLGGGEAGFCCPVGAGS